MGETRATELLGQSDSKHNDTGRGKPGSISPQEALIWTHHKQRSPVSPTTFQAATGGQWELLHFQGDASSSPFRHTQPESRLSKKSWPELNPMSCSLRTSQRKNDGSYKEYNPGSYSQEKSVDVDTASSHPQRTCVNWPFASIYPVWVFSVWAALIDGSRHEVHYERGRAIY